MFDVVFHRVSVAWFCCAFGLDAIVNPRSYLNKADGHFFVLVSRVTDSRFDLGDRIFIFGSGFPCQSLFRSDQRLYAWFWFQWEGSDSSATTYAKFGQK